MDRSKVMEALKAINNVLSRKGQHVTVTVTGGAAIMFLFPEFSRPVKDLDGCDINPELESAIEEVTYELDLPEGWFNNTSNDYYFPKEFAQGPKLSNLDVQCPSRNYLLCLKIMSGRPEERANDAKDVEFMIEHMPNIKSEKDWQSLYTSFFNKTDWKPWLAERARIAIDRKATFSREAAAEHPNQTGNPAEPLMTCMINQNEWKNNEDIHIFTEPDENWDHHETREPSAKLTMNAANKQAEEVFTDETGRFWGNQGAGVVFYCPETQKILVAKRSPHVNEPNTWGTWGGAMDDGETPAEAAKREALEEAGADVEHVDPVWTFQDPHSDFRYHNYVAVVTHEFEPHLDWETAGYQWVTLTAPPSPTHFGLKALWPHLKSWVEKQKVGSYRKRATDADLVERAKAFAMDKHSNQKRKWTGEPYFVHLEGVASLVRAAGGSSEQIAAAYLHDSIEDQGVTEAEILAEFGPKVAKLVVEMTEISKLEDGNRATRKAIDRGHYGSISPDGQSIKLADITNNGYDIVQTNPKFAKTYIPELRALYEVLTSGNPTLRRKAGEMLAFAEKKLANASNRGTTGPSSESTT